ncbi:MAG: MerR family transcriptional regulator [Erysipelotrichaceae bacterium]|nr:MerR family transcriptional regulator [Erysipelotrichaceae bacterium]
MYKIGDFSKLSKTTIKALRYYEKEGLLKPAFIDPNTSYRFYESSQLTDISKIISLRQAGLSIKNIKNIFNGSSMVDILDNRKNEIEDNLIKLNTELSKIKYLMEGINMQNEIIIKKIPSYTVYFRDKVISNFGEVTEFVLETGALCIKANPTLKCITPDYCYISYLDGEYKEENIKVRYAQAVDGIGKETEEIKFMNTPEVLVASIYHKGAYDSLRDSYNIILKYIEDNNYEIVDNVRECYIDGCWNKDDENDYLTEIQFPIKKK